MSQTPIDERLKTWRTRCRPYLWVLRVLAFVFMVMALARPIRTEKSNYSSYKTELIL